MISGAYKIYSNGLLVSETSNIITNLGKGIILRYLAGNTGMYAGAICVGTSGVAAAATDTKLGFEFSQIGRAHV